MASEAIFTIFCSTAVLVLGMFLTDQCFLTISRENRTMKHSVGSFFGGFFVFLGIFGLGYGTFLMVIFYKTTIPFSLS
jgi:hypothetical protein